MGELSLFETSQNCTKTKLHEFTKFHEETKLHGAKVAQVQKKKPISFNCF